MVTNQQNYREILGSHSGTAEDSFSEGWNCIAQVVLDVSWITVTSSSWSSSPRFFLCAKYILPSQMHGKYTAAFSMFNVCNLI